MGSHSDRKRPLRGDSAVASFFEDIPALIVVTVGFAMFFVSTINAYNMYAQSASEQAKISEYDALATQLMKYDKIVINGTYTLTPAAGRFDYWKLENMTTDTMKSDLVTGDFRFNVSIVEYLDYTMGMRVEGRRWEFGDPIPASPAERYTSHQTVAIVVDVNTVHIGHLIVTVWEE